MTTPTAADFEAFATPDNSIVVQQVAADRRDTAFASLRAAGLNPHWRRHA